MKLEYFSESSPLRKVRQTPTVLTPPSFLRNLQGVNKNKKKKRKSFRVQSVERF